ncbi:MAG TPA: arginine--tRNA ligase [Deltaproteobacteria bacterium]|nr:arginine--tRNA ligase [Deltaproteobacteria bacterium]
MRAKIAGLVEEALRAAVEDGELKAADFPEIILEKPKREEFGDFATNVAMLLASSQRRPPREIAATLARRIAGAEGVERCEVAGPGFINIFLEKSFWAAVLAEIARRGRDFGRSAAGRGRRVQVEFVSANPTGPLHIGHGRGAAIGDSLANLLEAAGFDVTREYYLNDVGRQMNTLAESVRLRYLEMLGREIDFPDDHYRGDYIRDIARDVVAKHGDRFLDEPEERCRDFFRDFAKEAILEGIKKDLKDFGVCFDVWYSEASLHERGVVAETIGELRRRGHVYDKDGATWLATSALGDDKDRVLVKADGSLTYFASDIAYHREKLERGFDEIIDIWGADHHGYGPRMKALFRALGCDEGRLRIVFIQLVSLTRGGEPVAMSTRAGEFVTLRDVMDEVGSDACRFFFLMRKSDAHLEFDLDLAKSQAPENPVYYVQYCHARICSIGAFAAEKGFTAPSQPSPRVLARLAEKDELRIIRHLSLFEEVVVRSAEEAEPHRMTFYLRELAGLFHSYYNHTRVVTDDDELTAARLLLCSAVRTVIANGLGLIGVSAPEKM